MLQTKHKTSHREAKLQSWGNSKAIRLAKDILEEAGFNTKDDILLDVEVEPNQITFVRKVSYTISKIICWL